MEVRRRLRHQLRQVVNVHKRLAVCRLWPASWVGVGAAHVWPGRGDGLGIGMVCRVVGGISRAFGMTGVGLICVLNRVAHGIDVVLICVMARAASGMGVGMADAIGRVATWN